MIEKDSNWIYSSFSLCSVFLFWCFKFQSSGFLIQLSCFTSKASFLSSLWMSSPVFCKMYSSPLRTRGTCMFQYVTYSPAPISCQQKTNKNKHKMKQEILSKSVLFVQWWYLNEKSWERLFWSNSEYLKALLNHVLVIVWLTLCFPVDDEKLLEFLSV